MNLAILHYHLNPGGVTRVIGHHLQVLDAALPASERCRVVLLYDGQAAGWDEAVVQGLENIDVEHCPLSELSYNLRPDADDAALAAAIHTTLQSRQMLACDTLLHVHNHSLGKNVATPRALRRLAEAGYPLLLQTHDFAEDFRAENYRAQAAAIGGESYSEVVYPQAVHIHYATLNRRDFEVLSTAGVNDDRLHFLPNPVPPLPVLPDRATARRKLHDAFGIVESERFTLYPVRAIRRKNIGELLLHAALAEEDHRFGISLAPRNPAEVTQYAAWVEFAAAHDLPVIFDTGGDGGLEFLENLSAADGIITTSVAEGFGMAYLECWLAGRPLCGRNLPEITVDFVESGVDLNALYDRWNVPLDWIGPDVYTAALSDAAQQVAEAYNVPPVDAAALHASVERRLIDGCIDVGDLNEQMQAQVIERVLNDDGAGRELQAINALRDASTNDVASLVEQNAQAIDETYGLRSSGQRLKDLYDTVLASRRNEGFAEPADAATILNAFLSIDRLRLLRV